MPAAAAVPASIGSPYHSFSASSTPPKQKVTNIRVKNCVPHHRSGRCCIPATQISADSIHQRPQPRPSNTDTDRHQKCASRTAQYDTPQMECLIHHQCRQTKKYTIRQEVFQKKLVSVKFVIHKTPPAVQLAISILRRGCNFCQNRVRN